MKCSGCVFRYVMHSLVSLSGNESFFLLAWKALTSFMWTIVAWGIGENGHGVLPLVLWR